MSTGNKAQQVPETPETKGIGDRTFSQANEPWLGVLPADWTSSRIRNIAALSPGYSDGAPLSDELCAVVPMEFVSADGKIDGSSLQAFEDISSGLTIFEAGDVLFAKITPCMENGKGAYVENLPTRYAFGSTEFHVLRPNGFINPKFLYYYTFNPVFRAYAAENMSGAAGQKRVSSRFLKDTRLFLPPRKEQERIAAFLDASCAAIDAAVAVKERQMETLHLLRKSVIMNAVTKGLSHNEQRDSGVEWFGKIPKHWKCRHLKRFTQRIQTGCTPPTDNPDYYMDGTIPWYAPGSYDGDIDLHEPRKLINELARHEGVLRIFTPLSVFLIGIGATIGKVGLINTNASCNQQIIGIETNERLSGRYLAYQLKIYEDIIPNIATATTLPIFDQVKTGYLPTLQPPRKEQQTICDFLDKKLLEIKKITAGIENQICTLIGFRKSLIHECVTGQRRITESDLKKVKAYG